MSLLSEFKQIQKATDVMMENVKHLHDSPISTVRRVGNDRVRKGLSSGK